MSFSFRDLVSKGRILAAVIGMACCGEGAVNAEIRVIYVATNGLDTNSGTEDKPVGTVQKAVSLAAAHSDSSEIVMRAGLYTESLQINEPNGGAASNPERTLVLRAYERDGQPEEVIFDGSVLIDDLAQPYPGEEGCYFYTLPFSTSTFPRIWEESGLKFYSLAADFAALRRRDRSCLLLDAERKLVFRPAAGESPRGKRLRVAVKEYAFRIFRNKVTVRHLNFQNYQTNQSATPVNIRGHDSTVEFCRIYNAYRGVTLGAYGFRNRVAHCRINDCGTGVISYGYDALIEHNHIENLLGSNPLMSSHSQDDAGIHYYYPAQGGVSRFNYVRGFMNGIFVKALSGKYLHEHNTLVYEKPRGFLTNSWGVYQNLWSPQCMTRFNIIAGYESALALPEKLVAGSVVDDNIFWAPDFESSLQKNLAAVKAKGVGARNQILDPLFASPEELDYQLLPQSPAVSMSRDGGPLGCYGVVGVEYQGKPNLRIKMEAPAVLDSWALLPETGQDSYLTKIRDVPCSVFASGIRAMSRLRVRINRGSAVEIPFAEVCPLILPDEDADHLVSFAVADTRGIWSSEQSVRIRLARNAPQMTSGPEVLANRYGALVSFTLDRLASCKLEYFDGAAWKVGTTYDPSLLPGEFCRRNTRVTLGVAGLQAGQTYPYRVLLTDALKQERVVSSDDLIRMKGEQARASVEMKALGEPRTMYLAPEGEDAADRGGQERPLRTLQYAFDRALPGDRILLLPGIYPEGGMLTHGGVAEAPVVVESVNPLEAILDGAWERGTMLYLYQAPHVKIRGLRIRWFLKEGIYAWLSPNLSVTQSRFINREWGNDQTMGRGIYVLKSPQSEVASSVFACMLNGVFAYHSPEFRFTHNTTADIRDYGFIMFDSAAGSVVTHNIFAYTAIAGFHFDDTKVNRVSMVLDYNLYAASIAKEYHPVPPEHKLSLPLHFPYFSQSKHLVSTRSGATYGLLDTLAIPETGAVIEGWRTFSGKEEHSFIADPRFVDPESDRFDLRQDSPALLPDGEYIGVEGYRPSLPQPPRVRIVYETPVIWQRVPATINFKVEAEGSQAGIRQVQYYLDRQPNSIRTTAPFTYTRVESQATSYEVVAVATDERGLKEVSVPVTVVVSHGSAGDVDGDGQITAQDARLVAQCAVKLIELTAEQLKTAEVSGDGQVTAYDAALIAQRAVGLIDKFPVEP